MKERGWLEEVDDEFRLTEQGLAICDEDEGEVDKGFLSCWPTFREVEIEEVLDIATRLNKCFEEVIRQTQE